MAVGHTASVSQQQNGLPWLHIKLHTEGLCSLPENQDAKKSSELRWNSAQAFSGLVPFCRQDSVCILRTHGNICARRQRGRGISARQ